MQVDKTIYTDLCTLKNYRLVDVLVIIMITNIS